MSAVGECRECVTRKNDHSEKELHKCSYCGRFFCSKHFEPKPVFIRDFARRFKSPEIVTELEKEANVEGKHPCFQFTHHWFEEQDQKLKLERKRLKEWLDKSKEFPRIPTIKPVREYPKIKIKKYRYSRKKLIRNITMFLFIVALIGGVYHYRAFVIPILLRFMDRTPPTISIVSPEEGAVLHGIITVEAYADDPGGIEKVELEVGTRLYTVMTFNNVTGYWIGRLDTRVLLDGIDSIKVKAIDKAGNTAEKMVVVTVDNTSPVITIISPRMIYRTDIIVYSNGCSIDLIYIVNEPTSWVGYSLNNAENITLTGNTTLSNFSPGQYNLIIYANDTAGNMAFSRTSFTVTKIFNSLDELISFLREDDLSDVEWTVSYTCHEFAKDFIQRAEMKGYYCFTYYSLFGDEMDEFVSAVNSIKVIKTYSWGTEIRWYTLFTFPGVGHAVVLTTVDGMDVIVDPQTDIIMAMKDFTVLYEGEITQE